MISFQKARQIFIINAITKENIPLDYLSTQTLQLMRKSSNPSLTKSQTHICKHSQDECQNTNPNKVNVDISLN